MVDTHTRNRKLAFNLLLLATGMLMLAYASVPLYRLFCQVTGFGGTPDIAASAPSNISDRQITIRFNADIDKNLPWAFAPESTTKKVYIGEESLTYYTAENKADAPVTGHAVYNVVPHKAGPYFAKIECFCFQDQTLNAKQSVHMPISFFVDPAILEDPEMRDVDTITLSYTFFKATAK